MKKLIALATIIGFGFCVANAQTTPSTNVSGTPTNLSTAGAPVKKQGTAAVKPASTTSSNLTTTSSPLKKQGTTTTKQAGNKMAGKVGAPASKANKASSNKMQTGTAPIQK